MIIDVHVHLNHYGPAERPSIAARLDRLREAMTRHAVDHALVLSSYLVNDDRPGTEEVLAAVEGDARFRVVEGVGVRGPKPPDWGAIEARLRSKRTIALKFYPGYEHVYPTDPEFVPGLELAGKYGVPIYVHSGDVYLASGKLKFAHPLHVDDLAVDYPDVRFIIAHLGNPWLDVTSEILYKNDNVYADISGLTLEEFQAPLEAYMRTRVRDLLLYAGEPDRVLFGSDWPLVRIGPYIRFVDQLGLDPAHRAKLMGENAARLFRLERGPASV